MILRAIFVALVLSCCFIPGCCTRSGSAKPPPFRLCNIARLYDEVAWFYTDVQDTFFGVDYYYYIDHEFDATPY